MRTLTATLFAIAVAAGAGATARADQPASDAATVKLFNAQCASCHGKDGKGKTTAGKRVGVKDWTDPKTLAGKSDADLEKSIREGNKGDDGKQRMAAFTKLHDDQVKQLIGYVRGLSQGGARPGAKPMP